MHTDEKQFEFSPVSIAVSSVATPSSLLRAPS
jgi:hypothetical protein